MQMPALQWQKSRRPNASATVCTMASTCAGSVTSHATAITFRPVASASSAAVFSASAISMSTMAISAPASQKAVAVALPMPRAPPVTKPALPARLIFSRMLMFTPFRVSGGRFF